MVIIQHPRLGMLNNYMNDYKLVTIRMRMSGGSCPSCIMAVPMSRHGVRIPEGVPFFLPFFRPGMSRMARERTGGFGKG